MEKKEAIKFITEFMTEINTQDNRGTASPYFYVIRTAYWVSSYHEGEGDRITYSNKEDSEDSFSVESTEEARIKFVKLQLEECSTEEEADNLRKKYKKMSDWDIEIEIERKYNNFWEDKEWREECCFFTDSEAKAHLKANHYHYSKDAHTYVKYFWRAPDIAKFFKAVAVMCDLEYINH